MQYFRSQSLHGDSCIRGDMSCGSGVVAPEHKDLRLCVQMELIPDCDLMKKGTY